MSNNFPADFVEVEELSSDDEVDEQHHHRRIVEFLQPIHPSHASGHPTHTNTSLRRSGKRSRTPVHVLVSNTLNDHQDGHSVPSSPPAVMVGSSVSPQPAQSLMPGSGQWPWPWGMPFPTNTWNGSTSDTQANAVAICTVPGCSHSHNHSHRQAHIPPTHEEKDVILAEEIERRKREREQIDQAVNKYKLEQQEREKREKHIKDDAIRDERDRLAKEEKRLKDEKKQWEAEQTEKRRKDDEEAKKREKDIEDEIRKRMAKYGFHNREIEATVAGKKEHYCHAHDRPYPCDICLRVHGSAHLSVRKGHHGGLEWVLR